VNERVRVWEEMEWSQRKTGGEPPEWTMGRRAQWTGGRADAWKEGRKHDRKNNIKNRKSQRIGDEKMIYTSSKAQKKRSKDNKRVDVKTGGYRKHKKPQTKASSSINHGVRYTLPWLWLCPPSGPNVNFLCACPSVLLLAPISPTPSCAATTFLNLLPVPVPLLGTGGGP